MIEINDDYIKSLYFTKKETINSNYLKSSWLEKHPEINDYLANRYNDSLSYKETLYRILLGIEKRPVCKFCGNPVRFEANHRMYRNRNGWPYMKYCSPKCQANDPDVKNKHKETCTEKYGVDNPAKIEKVKEQIKQTNIIKYGVENVYQSEEIKNKIKQTNLERYGVENVLQTPVFLKKLYNTNLKKYGAKTYGESAEGQKYQNKFILKQKETCLKKYGVDSYTKTQEYRDFVHKHKDEFMKKQYNTKKKNKSFNVSEKEELLYKILLAEYEVLRQYRSEKYQYACDFYIPLLDLYIEYQGNWTHGQHPYNEYKDVVILEHMKAKAENSDFYKNAITVWIVRDVQKRNDAIKNNLNYLEIYPHADLITIPDIIKDNYTKNITGKHLIIGTK